MCKHGINCIDLSYMGNWLNTWKNGSKTRNTHFCQVLEKYVAFQHIGFHMSQHIRFLLGVLRRGWGLLDLVYFEVFGRIDVFGPPTF